MHSPATTRATTPDTTPPTTPAITPSKPPHPDEHEDTPRAEHPPMQLPTLANDFYLDTHFNPVWMSGPHVFSFAEDGTVVRPEMYSLEPYPGYHAHRPLRLKFTNVSHFQGFSPREQKPWKNVAVTELDNAEFAAIQLAPQASEGGGQQHYLDEGWEGPTHDGEEPELVCT